MPIGDSFNKDYSNKDTLNKGSFNEDSFKKVCKGMFVVILYKGIFVSEAYEGYLPQWDTPTKSI